MFHADRKHYNLIISLIESIIAEYLFNISNSNNDFKQDLPPFRVTPTLIYLFFCLQIVVVVLVVVVTQKQTRMMRQLPRRKQRNGWKH